jgi:hypothetical protein
MTSDGSRLILDRKHHIKSNYSADVENPLLELLKFFPLKSPCQIGRQDSELPIPIKDKLGPSDQSHTPAWSEQLSYHPSKKSDYIP